MSVTGVIQSALAPVSVPTALHFYSGAATTYIVYFEVVNRPDLHADNQLENTLSNVQVSLYSKGNYNELLDQVKLLMKESGFLYTGGISGYEQDTKFYHYHLTYNYSIKIQG
ncbi:hypothetical protein [Jeotgalibacillus aurantiacus]|uniref:hypothetical protein n=1 Tax=Jeotgalibacillus aurantiacus TaxID=2763266 RepID=UPI001D0B1E17|nr:hypothetical protein [Jeotgalibacillus aurantiacus]